MPRSLNDDHINAQIGQRIRNRRKQLLMSQSALAGHVHVSFQAIQKYENGQIALTAVRLLMLAEALNVPIAYFLDGLGSGSSLAATAANTELSGKDMRVVNQLRQLPGDMRDAIEGVISGALRRHEREKSTGELD